VILQPPDQRGRGAERPHIFGPVTLHGKIEAREAGFVRHVEKGELSRRRTNLGRERISLKGFVMLSKEERDKAAARVFSSGRDRLAPRVHRRRAAGAVRFGGYEVALDVENVEDGCMR